MKEKLAKKFIYGWYLTESKIISFISVAFSRTVSFRFDPLDMYDTLIKLHKNQWKHEFKRHLNIDCFQYEKKHGCPLAIDDIMSLHFEKFL